jgi:prevent-host-death family protein
MHSGYSLPEAQACFNELIRRVADGHERITITDHERPAAVLIDPEHLADLEDALAIAEYRLRKASGTGVTVPHAEVRRILGLDPR